MLAVGGWDLTNPPESPGSPPVVPEETAPGAMGTLRQSVADALGRARQVGLLTLNSLWRGVVGVYNSDDLTHAASIAYYALLSLFPFLLLISSVLGSITADEHRAAAALNFVLRYFPTRLEFVTRQLRRCRKDGCSWDSPAAWR